MLRLARLIVLFALVMVLMGTVLYARTYRGTIQTERRCECGYGGIDTGSYLVVVYFVAYTSSYGGGNTSHYTYHTTTTISGGSGYVPYDSSQAPNGASTVQYMVTPLNGIGTTVSKTQAIGDETPLTFTFPLMPTPPNLSHIHQ